MNRKGREEREGKRKEGRRKIYFLKVPKNGLIKGFHDYQDLHKIAIRRKFDLID
ncbi:hypothetical protein Anacy_5462 [Anabaena cylindrica PCC 7122]|uniref:Uncharacterized protein n=1 Tax=Anabaena cylindrica (strain ATCC 27899 / PCC 7122) TaxID=272123 RepID=K9ZQG8_ANACC|nr:hypothetical protein Anacy_5462 [Anabaena cylindrica PCC 7122]BAY02134.1 hypothetical protein NIES19_13730 [Anabaena cylindrica PCC 7122]